MIPQRDRVSRSSLHLRVGDLAAVAPAHPLPNEHAKVKFRSATPVRIDRDDTPRPTSGELAAPEAPGAETIKSVGSERSRRAPRLLDFSAGRIGDMGLGEGRLDPLVNRLLASSGEAWTVPPTPGSARWREGMCARASGPLPVRIISNRKMPAKAFTALPPNDGCPRPRGERIVQVELHLGTHADVIGQSAPVDRDDRLDSKLNVSTRADRLRDLDHKAA